MTQKELVLVKIHIEIIKTKVIKLLHNYEEKFYYTSIADDYNDIM